MHETTDDGEIGYVAKRSKLAMLAALVNALYIFLFAVSVNREIHSNR